MLIRHGRDIYVLDDGSLRVGRQIVKLLRQLILLRVKDYLHLSVAFTLLSHAGQVSVQVRRELLRAAKNKHASEGAEHLLLAVVASNLLNHQLCLGLLVLSKLELSLTVAKLLHSGNELL